MHKLGFRIVSILAPIIDINIAKTAASFLILEALYIYV